MTESKQSHSEEPRKNSLKVWLRSKPVATVETSVGRIYLYPLRVRDMTAFGKLEWADAANHVRNLLASIGSLTLESDESPERIPLDPEIAKTLSEADVELLAEAYVQSYKWQKAEAGACEPRTLTRGADEPASTYMIRLIKNEVEYQHKAAQQLHEKIVGSSIGIFDQVRQRVTDLESTIKTFEDLSQPRFDASPFRENSEIRDSISERVALERERSEKMEMVRLTGRMTAESAKTLKELAEAATMLMEQFDERDRRTDKSTRKQINIAVYSVVISAILALFSLIFSVLSYLQDRDKGFNEDQWKEKQLTTIEQRNQQGFVIERENEDIREQMDYLSGRVSNLEAAKEQ